MYIGDLDRGYPAKGTSPLATQLCANHTGLATAVLLTAPTPTYSISHTPQDLGPHTHALVLILAPHVVSNKTDTIHRFPKAAGTCSPGA